MKTIFSQSLRFSLFYFQEKKKRIKEIWPFSLFFLFGMLCLLIDPCFAVPDGIPVISEMLTNVVPYAAFAFTAGGIYYSAVNGKMVVNGDYKRVIPASISLLGTTMGIAGLFGETALTVTVG